MTTVTSRLGLDQAVPSDPPSALRTSIAANATILDGAVTITEGAFASRPSTGLYVGQTYYATNVNGGTWYFYTGSAWLPIVLSGGGIGQLNPTIQATSTTATAGTMYHTNAGLTITAPAPVTGAVFGVSPNSSTSGASPVTIAYGTGTGALYGIGMGSGAPSFLLGTPESSVTLECADGEDWVIVAGQQDTNWVSLTTNFPTAGGAYPVAARLQGDRCSLRGRLQGNGISGPVTSGNPIATLPLSSMFPGDTVGPWVSYDSSEGIVELTLSTAGVITSGLTFATTSKLSLDNFSFFTS